MAAKRTLNLPQEEPEIAKFQKPSEKEHLFQVVDIYEYDSEMGRKLKLTEDDVSVKCEVVGGEEAGRTLLQRLTLNESSKGFWATRIFLKALGEDYKGVITIDTDMWSGLQFYATVVHSGDFANIDRFNFDKKIDQRRKSEATVQVDDPKKILWED